MDGLINPWSTILASCFNSLEEFGNLKRIHNFSKVIALIRSKGVSLNIITQDLAQVQEVYKDNAKTIINNCSSILVYPGLRGKENLDYITSLTGRATVEITTASNDTQKVSRELMTNDEVSY